MSLSKCSFVSIVLVAAIAGVSPAIAEPIPDAPTVTRLTVNYSDLNLRTVKGAAALVARISRAARQACGERAMVGPGAFVKRERRAACIREAEETAIAAVDHRVVTGIYAQTRGTIAATVATR